MVYYQVSSVLFLELALTFNTPLQTGIGTYTDPNAATPMSSSVAKMADEAVAWYLDAHVTEG